MIARDSVSAGRATAPTFLADAAMVQPFVSRKSSALGLQCALVARFTRDEAEWTSWSRDARQRWDAHTWFEAGCLAKLMTNLLVMEALRDCAFGLRTSAALLCAQGAGGASGGGLDDVRILHLLDHTHGLDAGGYDCAPLTEAGLIDLPSMIDRLVVRRRVHEPGALFSYGHAGYILLGALLEKSARVPFDELVKMKLRALGIDASHAGTWRCPATGGGGRLNAAACVAIARHYGALEFPARAAARTIGQLLEDCGRSLPGFSWRDDGFSLGWRREERGRYLWVGTRAGDTAALRFDPGRCAGLLVAGPDERVKSLGEQVAELSWGIPAGASNRPAVSSDPAPRSACTGLFADSESRFEVLETPRGLTVRATHATDAGGDQPIVQTLRHLGEKIFLALPPDRRGLHLAQFISETDGGRVSHLWNGARTWKRIG